MTAAKQADERARMVAAAAEVVDNAPPLTAAQVAMLRCAGLRHASDQRTQRVAS